MKKQTRVLIAVIIILLAFSIIGGFLYKYNSSPNIDESLNTYEELSLSLMEDWFIYLNYYDNKAYDNLSKVDLVSLYYYQDKEDFMINIEYFLDESSSDVETLKVALKGDKDNLGQLDRETITKINKNFLQGYVELFTLSNELRNNYLDSTFGSDVIYVGVNESKLKVINDLIYANLDEDRYNDYVEYFESLKD